MTILVLVDPLRFGIWLLGHRQSFTVIVVGRVGRIERIVEREIEIRFDAT